MDTYFLIVFINSLYHRKSTHTQPNLYIQVLSVFRLCSSENKFLLMNILKPLSLTKQYFLLFRRLTVWVDVDLSIVFIS
jgi:hypothetical protein